MSAIKLQFRSSVTEFDPGHVRKIVSSSGFFNPAEIDISVELVEERLRTGVASGYYFIFAETGNEIAGYACFGPIPATKESYDLYWIAVHNRYRGMGIGKKLLQASETAIRELGGKRIYVETSSRSQYEPTQGFYRSCGYRLEATLQDFYAPGDSKCIFVKVV